MVHVYVRLKATRAGASTQTSANSAELEVFPCVHTTQLTQPDDVCWMSCVGVFLLIEALTEYSVGDRLVVSTNGNAGHGISELSGTFAPIPYLFFGGLASAP